MTNCFDVSADHDAVRMLVDHEPLAWVLASDGYTGSQLPLLGEYGPSGELIGLIGHFATANPLAAAFSANPLATILFNGPQGYVSPRVAGKSNWAPTWNHAHLRIRASVKIDSLFTQKAVTMLVERMEMTSPQPWTERELEERYSTLMSRIVGFKADIIDINARFKLAQDEHPDVLSSILEHHHDQALTQWMRIFNKERLNSEASSDAT